MRTHTRATGATVLLSGILTLLTGCVQPATGDDPGPVSSACPAAIGPLVSADAAASEIVLAVDQSLSFWNSPAAQDRIRTETDAVVERAVVTGAALRVITFWGGASDAGTAVACPSMAARYNNEAAKEQKQNHLTDVAAAAVWEAVAEATRTPKKGTSVIGGWQAAADARPQVSEGSDRHVIMLSDGLGIPAENDLTVELGTAFATAAMYEIGNVVDAQKPSTAETNTLKAFWEDWLTQAGIAHPIVSSHTYA